MESPKADVTLGSGAGFDTSPLEPAPDTLDNGPPFAPLEPALTPLPPAAADRRNEAPGEVHILDFIGRAYEPKIQKFTVDKLTQSSDALQHMQDLRTAPGKGKAREDPASEGSRFRWIHFSDNNTQWAEVRCGLDRSAFCC